MLAAYIMIKNSHNSCLFICSVNPNDTLQNFHIFNID